jgi:D-alanyl-D-alanine carboxypeptidase (penicillin-binding protein 5/6)
MKSFRILNKNFLHKIIFLFLPLFLVIIVLVLFTLNLYLRENIEALSLVKVPLPEVSAEKYPILKKTFTPYISAQGVVIMDPDTKVVLYGKNPNLRFSSASTTKIMTALTALEYFKLDDVLTVYAPITDGSILRLKQNEQLTFENLLYAMLLPSANDAAFTIAENYPGGIKNFVKKMNENAKKWYLFNTSYEDPSGYDDGNYTTPIDLARLASVAKRNKEIARVVSTKQKVISDISGENVYFLENLNKLLGINGVDGIKTGYTEEAGQVLVTSKTYFDVSENKNRSVVIVVMGSADRFYDTEVLLSLITDNISYLSIHP